MGDHAFIIISQITAKQFVEALLRKLYLTMLTKEIGR